MSKRWNTKTSLLLFIEIILLFVFFFPLIARGEYLIGGDMVNQYIPYKHYLFENLRQGVFPLWNNQIFSGRPFCANIQVGQYYPLHYLMFFNIIKGYSWLTLLHYIIAMAGFYRLSRELSLSRESSHIASILFAFSAFFPTHILAGIVIFLFTGSWFGWLTWASLKYLRKGKPIYGLLAALCVYFLYTSGAPQIAFYSCIVAGFFILFRACSIFRTDRKKALLDTLKLSIYIICGAGMCAILLVPGFEFIRYSFERSQGLSWDRVTDCSVSKRYLTLMFRPFFFGNPGQEGYYWGGTEGYWEICPYFSIPALVLFICSFFFQDWKQDRLKKILLLSAFFISMSLSMGKNSLLYKFAYTYLPMFSSFRVPGRFIYPATIFFSLYLGLSLDHFQLKNKKKYITVFLGLIAVTFGMQFVMHNQFLQAMHFQFDANPKWLNSVLSVNIRDLIQAAGFALITVLSLLYLAYKKCDQSQIITAAALLISLSLALFGIHFYKYQPMAYFTKHQYKESAAIRKIKQSEKDSSQRTLMMDSVYSWQIKPTVPELSQNHLMMHNMRDARGYDPMNLRWYCLYFNLLAGFESDRKVGAFLFLPELVRPDLAALLNVRTIVNLRPCKNRAAFDSIQTDGRFYYHRLNQSKPAYLRFYSQWESCSEQDLIKNIKNQPGILQQKAYRLESDNIKSNLQPSQPSALSWHIADCDQLSGSIETAQSGYLMLNESWYPGWKMYIGDDIIKSERINLTFNGFLIPEGKHQFKIKFEPDSFYRGRIISLFFIFLITLFFAIDLWININNNRKHVKI